MFAVGTVFWFVAQILRLSVLFPPETTTRIGRPVASLKTPHAVEPVANLCPLHSHDSTVKLNQRSCYSIERLELKVNELRVSIVEDQKQEQPAGICKRPQCQKVRRNTRPVSVNSAI